MSLSMSEEKNNSSESPDPAANVASSNPSNNVISDSATALLGDDGKEQPAVGASIRSLAVSSRSLLSSDMLLTSTSAFMRELVENAIDSGANNITCNLTTDSDGSGAIVEIEVKDNGRGISKADRALVAQPHCTSKIRSFEDIVAASATGVGGISTFGFRGEALHCMACSCSTMIVQSKKSHEAVAWRTVWQNGVRKTEMDTMVAQAGSGTSVKLRGLFYNRPVRAAMAKKEARHEKEVMQELLRGYAFVAPKIRILCNNPPFSKPASNIPTATLSSSSPVRALELFRESLPLVVGTTQGLHQMMEFSGADSGFAVEGFITKYSVDPSNKELLRSKMDRVYLYISNSRSVNLPWFEKIIVAEWRAAATKQIQRNALRRKNIDPNKQSEAATAAISDIQTSFQGQFPLVLLKISLETASELLDLNRSPDKRDIFIGSSSDAAETKFKECIISVFKAALHEAMEKIEEQEQKKWLETRPSPAPQPGLSEPDVTTSFPNPVTSADNSVDIVMNDHIAIDQPLTAAASSSTAAPANVKQENMDDDVEIISSDIRVKTDSAPSSQTTTSTSGSRVDFSSFVRPLSQPQSFISPPTSTDSFSSPQLQQPLQPAVSSTPSNSSAQRMSQASSTSSMNPPTPKRPRLSNGSTPPSSTSPLKQTQLSVVDAVNSNISMAARTVQMDATMLDALTYSFTNTFIDDAPDTTAADSEHKFVACLPQGITILRLPAAATSSTTPTQSDQTQSSEPTPSTPQVFPTLVALSMSRADECTLFLNLLASSHVPSIPLDVAIPVNEDFPGLSREERDKLVSNMRDAKQLERTHAVPSGCISFAQAMQLCGFELQSGDDANEELKLVSVPSDASISIEDFLATLRHIWSDTCFNALGVLRVRRLSPLPEATPEQLARDAVLDGFVPSNAWRTHGIRAFISDQAIAAAATRASREPITSANSEKHALKLVEKMQTIVEQCLHSGNADDDWTKLACPHHKRVATRLTNKVK